MTIFSATKIYTFDDDDRVFKNLWVQESKITQLNNEQPLITNQSKVLLEDKYIIPGFIESHMHILGTGLQYIFPNFTDASSFEQIFDILLDDRTKNKELKL